MQKVAKPLFIQGTISKKHSFLTTFLPVNKALLDKMLFATKNLQTVGLELAL